MEQDVHINRYVIRFAIIYLVLLIGLGLLLGFLGTSSGTGATVGAMMGAAGLTVSRFLDDHKRLPTASERTQLIWLSFLASWLVSLIPFSAVMMLTPDGGEVLRAVHTAGLTIFAVVIAVLSAVYLGLLSLSYGFIARNRFAALQRKGRI